LKPFDYDFEIAHLLLVYPGLFYVPNPTGVQPHTTKFFINPQISRFFTRSYLPGSNAEKKELFKDRRVSPLLAGVAQLPPVTLVSASDDPLRPGCEILESMLKAEGGKVQHFRYPKTTHGFVTLVGLSPGSKARKDINDDIAYLLNTVTSDSEVTSEVTGASKKGPDLNRRSTGGGGGTAAMAKDGAAMAVSIPDDDPTFSLVDANPDEQHCCWWCTPCCLCDVTSEHPVKVRILNQCSFWAFRCSGAYDLGNGSTFNRACYTRIEKSTELPAVPRAKAKGGVWSLDHDIANADGEPMTVRIFDSVKYAGKQGRPVVLLFPGGGFVVGTPFVEGHDLWAKKIAS
ncbi:Tuliposide A-converting enzyme 1, partial [Durusdinium trenchii]